MRGPWLVSGALFCALSACDESADAHGSASGGRSGEDAGRQAGAAASGHGGNRSPDAGDASAPEGDAATTDAGSAADGGELAPGMQRVTIAFKAKLAGQDFACGQAFDGQGSRSSQVTPTDFRMFVQEVQLIDDQGHMAPVTFDARAPWQSSSVALLDFEDGTDLESGLGCALEGTPTVNTKITGIVAEGTYIGISFINGVPEALNHEDPTSLGAPLDAPGMYWDWLAGFRFIKLELRTVGVAASEVPPGGVLHVGSTGCFNAEGDAGVDDPQAKPAHPCKHPNRNRVTLMDYAVGKSVIVADVSQVFAASDLTKSVYCASSSGDVCTPLFGEVGLEYEDGSPLTTQALYSLEQPDAD